MYLLVRTCNYDRMNIERLVARSFVVLGGLFWGAAAFGADFGYRDESLLASAGGAALPLGLSAATLAIAWFYERLASAVLTLAALAVVIWGFAAGWEAGMWWTMGGVLVAPMVVAALLFLLASQTQYVCSLQEKTSYS